MIIVTIILKVTNFEFCEAVLCQERWSHCWVHFRVKSSDAPQPPAEVEVIVHRYLGTGCQESLPQAQCHLILTILHILELSF